MKLKSKERGTTNRLLPLSFPNRIRKSQNERERKREEQQHNGDAEKNELHKLPNDVVPIDPSLYHHLVHPATLPHPIPSRHLPLSRVDLTPCLARLSHSPSLLPPRRACQSCRVPLFPCRQGQPQLAPIMTFFIQSNTSLFFVRSPGQRFWKAKRKSQTTLILTCHMSQFHPFLHK
ncbi:hypothetical protein ACSQ67_025319 [Phaseolus vulgaris]